MSEHFVCVVSRSCFNLLRQTWSADKEGPKTKRKHKIWHIKCHSCLALAFQSRLLRVMAPRLKTKPLHAQEAIERERCWILRNVKILCFDGHCSEEICGAKKFMLSCYCYKTSLYYCVYCVLFFCELALVPNFNLTSFHLSVSCMLNRAGNTGIVTLVTHYIANL